VASQTSAIGISDGITHNDKLSAAIMAIFCFTSHFKMHIILLFLAILYVPGYTFRRF